MPTRMKLRVLALAVCAVLLLALPAAAQASWGAIAVNPETGKTGVSSAYGSANAAKNSARSQCGGSHCRVAVWIFNGYGALVLKSNGRFVAGLGKTRNLAVQSARQRAHEQSARLVTTVFSGLS